MTKLILLGIGLAAAFLLLSPFSNQASFAAGPPDGLPDRAIIPLGQAKDVDGRTVEGYRIIHYRRGGAKPDGVGNGKGGGGGSTTSSCYAFLANGAKWKTVEPWLINTGGGPTGNLFDIFSAAIDEWESEAAANILGTGATTTDALSADSSSPDGLNEVYFGTIPDSGVIAVTTVWGVFAGPPSSRQLVEWDMVFDIVDFGWSTTGAAGLMDFENLAQHELGHAMGLAHPSDACTEETMFRFADFGETKKRDLNDGDKAGIKALYK
jgi:hypothetical protein